MVVVGVNFTDVSVYTVVGVRVNVESGAGVGHKSSHLLFVPTPARYLLVERDGAPPQPGARLELEQGAFAVTKLGDAPFPGEDRPCAFLLPLG